MHDNLDFDDHMTLNMTLYNGGQTTTLSNRQDGMTWMEVTDIFLQFLKGSGFHVTAGDIADYLNEEYGMLNSTTNTVTFTPE